MIDKKHCCTYCYINHEESDKNIDVNTQTDNTISIDIDTQTDINTKPLFDKLEETFNTVMEWYRPYKYDPGCTSCPSNQYMFWEGNKQKMKWVFTEVRSYFE